MQYNFINISVFWQYYFTQTENSRLLTKFNWNANKNNYQNTIKLLSRVHSTRDQCIEIGYCLITGMGPPWSPFWKFSYTPHMVWRYSGIGLSSIHLSVCPDTIYHILTIISCHQYDELLPFCIFNSLIFPANSFHSCVGIISKSSYHQYDMWMCTPRVIFSPLMSELVLFSYV